MFDRLNFLSLNLSISRRSGVTTEFVDVDFETSIETVTAVIANATCT